MEFETFPKNSLLKSYGLTLYVHKGMRAFRPTMIVETLRRSNPQLKGELEVMECKEFPHNHPMEKRRGVRIITLHADQTFLDSLYEFPPNYPFNASILCNIYIRGGARLNPKDPKAKRPAGRTRFGKKSVEKFLTIVSGT